MSIGLKLAKSMLDDAIADMPVQTISSQIKAAYLLARLDAQRGVVMSIVPTTLDAVEDRLRQYHREFEV